MFSKDVTNSDEFLDMPLSSQALYFHLWMNADDDGFVQPKSIMRLIQAKDDDMRILLARGFVIEFHWSIIVITHRKQNNEIRQDRKRNTIYKEHLQTLGLSCGKYVLNPALEANDNQMTTKWQPNDNQMPDNLAAQDSIVEDSIVEDSIVEDSIVEDKKDTTPDGVPPRKIKSIINKDNKGPAIKIYDYIKKLTGVIDGDLNDCVYLHYKLEGITHFTGSSIEKLEQIIPLMIEKWISTYYSISSPQKLTDNLGTIVSKIATGNFIEAQAENSHIYIK